jgi:hypothetical protein
MTCGTAGSAAPAANPETDLRKSRRFMRMLQLKKFLVGTGFARFVPRLNERLAML